jgi:hypothetical protein
VNINKCFKSKPERQNNFLKSFTKKRQTPSYPKEHVAIKSVCDRFTVTMYQKTENNLHERKNTKYLNAHERSLHHSRNGIPQPLTPSEVSIQPNCSWNFPTAPAFGDAQARKS